MLRQIKRRPVNSRCLFPAFTFALALVIVGTSKASAQFDDWQHSGSLYILTTSEGANLPASAEEVGFPALVRLHKDFFPFAEAADDGSDLRFSILGEPVPYEIEDWDSKRGTASVWVRVPVIRGNDRQEMKIHWGNPKAHSASSGKAVFSTSNGHVAVWHLGEQVRDVLGGLESEDKGTTLTNGMIGHARHFPGQKGIFCGTEIRSFPMDHSPHTTQTWFRSEVSNGRIVSWGKEHAQGKVQMWYRSPAQIRMDCYFSNGDVKASIPGDARGWNQAVHTFENGKSFLYINGEKCGTGNPRATSLSIERPARMWIGGWYNNFDFVGDIDEVRISNVARSADWIRLEYENQKPHQTLVGPIVQSGNEFSVTPSSIEVSEDEPVELSARAGGAQKVYWSLVNDSNESVIATDRFAVSFNSGRVRGSRTYHVRFDAVFSNGVRSIEVPVTVKETLPEPEFTLSIPPHWNGRETIEVRPKISNLAAMRSAGVDDLEYKWTVSGIATLRNEASGKLILNRSQNSGMMTVALSLSNGGEPVEASSQVKVEEPDFDPWVARSPDSEEMPVNGQFYARARDGLGVMRCRGILKEKADEIFLRVFADDQKYAEEKQEPAKDGAFSLAVDLKAGLIKYRTEFGIRVDGRESILAQANDIVCGDAYLVNGQSNALATDTREESPRVANEWVRSYGRPRFYREGERENLWCRPVWKAQPEHLAELGWWGMRLANQLVESQQVPIFILNAARGGTRIDQHQRNDEDPTDVQTIYGNMLWRLKAARLTHGIRAIIWHQGENDQGAAGPDGGYGWETYQRYFINMSADWKRDFPNVEKYYLFQIRPNACAMGGGNGDMLREKQRTLSRLYSDMEVLSTVGIKPGGGCHYPLEGWSVFADMVQRLIERDFYGRSFDEAITAPNLVRASWSNATRDSITLEFDQLIDWNDQLHDQLFLDDVPGQVVKGEADGRLLKLTLRKPSAAERVTYLKEMAWSPEKLLVGTNGMAALSFCNVPLESE